MNKAKLALIGLFGGFVSGILGLGGGILFVPLMVLLLKMEQHEAHGTSLFVIAPTALLGATVYTFHGNVRFEYVLWLMVFAMVAAPLGVRACSKISSENLRKLYAVFLLVVAVRMLF
ncbi:MAG: sulfite exporter TauE/SafE family protein [Candidatus Saganbacteria bacterium]|nr:sulfite exporter TauE/SafE family protein [Candidatus Saganbacteria bacterium]